MDFIRFQEKVEILDKKRGKELRNKYINRFINTDHKIYKEQIQIYHKFIDGYCYLGYLWDCILNPIVIDEAKFEEKARRIGKVYAFWDIHSCERIFIKNYWKFDKDAILNLEMETLMQGEEFLPEDIYIFDDSFAWTLIKTHEDIQGKRFCLQSGRILDI